MAYIVSVVNQKGGTGKTTSTVNLGAYLAALGKYVLLVDLDPQANASVGVGMDIRGGNNPNLYHSLVGGILPEDVVRKTEVFGLDVLPASPDLAGALIELIQSPRREFRLYEILRRIRTNYDYILIDCPPSMSLLTLNGLVAADGLIIPVQCEYYALEGLGQLLNTIDLIKGNLGRDLKLLGALLTMYDRRNRLDRQVKNEIYKNFPGRVFDTIIPRNVGLAEAPSYGKSILQYDPGSKGARAYRGLAEELIKLEKELF